MKKYRFSIDDSTIEGNNANEVIASLHRSARMGEPTIEQYRAGFARRLKDYNGTTVRSEFEPSLV